MEELTNTWCFFQTRSKQRLVSAKGFSIFLTRYLKKGHMKFETWGRVYSYTVLNIGA